MPPVSSVPGLQQKLFQRLGVSHGSGGGGGGGSAGGRRGNGPASRKDQRKAQRQQKKSHRYSRPAPTNGSAMNRHRVEKPQKSQSTKKKGIEKETTQKPVEDEFDESDEEEENEEDGLGQFDDLGDESLSEAGSEEDLDGLDDFEDGEDDELDSGSDSHTATRKASKTAKHLPEDDEIDEYERKLGIKGKKNLPKSFKDDGLDDIMGELDRGDGESDSEDEDSKKRKREDDDWLASKRKKAAQAASASAREAHGSEESDDSNEGSDDEGMGLDDDDSFGGFSSADEEEAPAPKRERENPYVAPKTNVAVKYVPPALRRAAGQDDAAARLRKQVQGQINRLTDDNILSIVQAVKDIYDQNARGDVTEAVTDALLDQLCKPEALPDQFFVLSGGFCAALYKVIGSSFGSHIINEVVKLFGRVYEKALAFTDDPESGIPKEPSNIIAFLTQLYTFEVVSAKIVFDYMERLLQDLNEINVELLLRICRMAGALLRRDDPSALKNVANELTKAVNKAGSDNTSVRTRFMVETINDLKNKKKKARGLDSGVVSDAVQRMKKRLGELKSQNRRLDGLAPMGMGLDDVEGAETRGKWWLVGASVPAREGQYSRTKDSSDRNGAVEGHDLASDSEDMSIIFPDLSKKARGQSLTTETEIAIFTAVMGATDVKEGYQRFKNLRIKNNDRQQLARVLVQCAGSELEYNGYYAQVAKMACADGRIRFALKTRLWGIFRSLGEPLFGEAAEDEEETIDTVRMQDEARLEKVAMFFADLVHEGAMGIDVLKPLDIPTITAWTMKFMTHFVFELLDGCRGKGEKEDASVAKVFGTVRELPLLAAGLGWLLRERDPVAGRRKLGPKKKERLERVSEKAQVVLQSVSQGG
ncbi:MIF4G domain-containing protein [Sarocladium implicatum]|nr:MIF4G domain-containing protein [Sarocladium implicatum]